MTKNWISKLPPSIKLKSLRKKNDLKINSISLYSAIKKLPKIGFRSFPLVLNEKSLRKKNIKINSISLYSAIKKLPKIGFRSFTLVLN